MSKYSFMATKVETVDDKTIYHLNCRCGESFTEDQVVIEAGLDEDNYDVLLCNKCFNKKNKTKNLKPPKYAFLTQKYDRHKYSDRIEWRYFLKCECCGDEFTRRQSILMAAFNRESATALYCTKCAYEYRNEARINYEDKPQEFELPKPVKTWPVDFVGPYYGDLEERLLKVW